MKTINNLVVTHGERVRVPEREEHTHTSRHTSLVMLQAFEAGGTKGVYCNKQVN